MLNHAWRHLFISQAPRYRMDPRTTLVITGHSSSDVHEKAYLEECVDVMAREIERISYLFDDTLLHSKARSNPNVDPRHLIFGGRWVVTP